MFGSQGEGRRQFHKPVWCPGMTLTPASLTEAHMTNPKIRFLVRPVFFIGCNILHLPNPGPLGVHGIDLVLGESKECNSTRAELE